MIEKGNLSSFNLERVRDIQDCGDVQIASIISNAKDSFPLIYELLTETTKFYTTYFYELRQKIRREKRLVVFDTPSRVQMTHEYTIEDVENLKQGFHFLFNATERLSWLKIFLEEKRISIASKGIVVSKLVDKLGDELDRLAFIVREDKIAIANRLYNLSDGKPCFVEFNKDEHVGQQSLLLSISFFDSIQNKQRYGCKRCWSPLQEKLLTYNYTTLSDTATSWIYFKAPTNFVLKVKNNAEERYVEHSKSNDDEITSIVLIPSGQSLSVDFDISVEVPDALSWWYNGMLYVAIITALLCVRCIISPFEGSVISVLNNVSLAVIAALIATRGWLMSEEQVMKKMSRWYTLFVSVLLLLVLLVSVRSNFGKHNEKATSAGTIVGNDSVAVTPMDTITRHENDESRISVSFYRVFLNEKE